MTSGGTLSQAFVPRIVDDAHDLGVGGSPGIADQRHAARIGILKKLRHGRIDYGAAEKSARLRRAQSSAPASHGTYCFRPGCGGLMRASSPCSLIKPFSARTTS